MISHLDENTLEKRLKVAAGFYKNHFGGEQVNAAVTQEKLQALSSEYTPASWRNLRAAIACFWYHQGDKITAEQIRNTKRAREEVAQPKRRKKRCKKISDGDWIKLLDQPKEEINSLAYAVLILGFRTGMRPIEMTNVQATDRGTIFITGAKKRHDRGLDREILFSHDRWSRWVKWAIEQTYNRPVKELQNAFASLVDRTFPVRRNKPTIYSMRHQMGSDLKASGLDRKAIAYLMGHRVTASVDKYGNRRSGGGKNRVLMSPAVSCEIIDSIVFENHRLPPYGKAEQDLDQRL